MVPMTFAQSPRAATVALLSVDGLTVRVTRKPIKHVYLRPTSTVGIVAVSAPTRLNNRDIADIVRARRPWLEQRWARLAEAQRAGAGDGGDGYDDDHHPPSITHSYGAPDLTELPSVDQRAVWSDERKRCAAEAIRAALPELLARWEPIVGRKPTHITLRLMTTRWGSCTPKTGRIRLNLQLGMMEPRFLEYVLVHEMAHLWGDGGHGVAFQRRMDSYLPNWREIRRELNYRIVV